MNDRSKYLLKNFFSFALGKMGTRVITFLLVPLYTYSLTTQQYGTVDLISTVCTVLMPILTLNISEAVMRFCMDDGADWQKVLHTGSCFLFSATLIGLATIPICRIWENFAEYGWPIYLYITTMAYSQFFLCYLRGKGKLTAYSVGNIIHAAVAAGLNILFLVVFQWGIRGYLLAYASANTIAALYSVLAGKIVLSIKGFTPDTKLCRQMLSYSVVLIPNSFMWWIINSSDRIMITAMLGATVNGVYAIAYKIPSMLSSFSGVFNQALGYSALRESQSDIEQQQKYFNQIYHGMVQILTIVVAIILILIKPFLRIYVEQNFYGAWIYIPYLSIGFLFLSLATFLSTFYMVHKNSLGFLLSGTLGAIINLLLNTLLIPRIGASGAALATCLSYIAVFVFRAVHTRSYMPIQVFKLRYITNLSMLLTMSIALYIPSIVISGSILLVSFMILLFSTRDVIPIFRCMLKKEGV